MTTLESKYRFFAFISYKREDEQWARWLQHKLEHYKLPSNLNGRTDLPSEIRPIFRDTSELTPGNLPEQINEALDHSKFLIVVCSPRSAQSEWVNKEIETFKSMGKTDNIIPFIIDGSPMSSNPTEECFPKAILDLPKEKEILGANIREMGREVALVKIVARMFDIRFDELWRRFEREQKRRKRIIGAVVTAFVLAVIGVALWMNHQRQETLRANWEMMENQARMVAEKTKEEVKKGNTYDAVLALLELLPQDGSRPFVPELDEALRIAYDSLKSNQWNYKPFDKKYKSIAFSDDEKYIVCESEQSIELLETESLSPHLEFVKPEEYRDLPFFISKTNDTIYLMDDHSLLSYYLPDGRFIEEIPYSETVLERCMTACCDFVGFKPWPWIEEWKKTVGLSSDVDVIGYNPYERLLVYTDAELNEQCFLYDCKTRQVVMNLNNDNEQFGGEVSGFITSCSFSSDGDQLAIAYISGMGIVIDLDDFSIKPFSCGNIECSHYTNWMEFGRGGQLLHGSIYDKIQIYDGQTLAHISSIAPYHAVFNEGSYATLNSNGKVCLINDPGDCMVCYRHENKNVPVSPVGFEKLALSLFFNDTVVNDRYRIGFDENYRLYGEDLKGEQGGWTRGDNSLFWDLKGFVQDGKYALAIKTNLMDYQFGVDAMDVATGITTYHFEPGFYIDCIYYNEDTEQLAFGNEEGPSLETVFSFPSLDHLIFLCKEETHGMGLSKEARKKYYLSAPSK